MLPQSFVDFFSRTSKSRHFRKVQFLVQVWAFYARRRLRLTRSNFLLTPQYLRRPLSLLRFQSRWQKLWGLVTVWDNFIYFIKPSLVTPQDVLFSARGNRVVRTSRGEVYRGSGTNNLSWTPYRPIDRRLDSRWSRLVFSCGRNTRAEAIMNRTYSQDIVFCGGTVALWCFNKHLIEK